MWTPDWKVRFFINNFQLGNYVPKIITNSLFKKPMSINKQIIHFRIHVLVRIIMYTVNTFDKQDFHRVMQLYSIIIMVTVLLQDICYYMWHLICTQPQENPSATSLQLFTYCWKTVHVRQILKCWYIIY